LVFDSLYAGHFFGRYAHRSRLLSGFDDTSQMNDSITHDHILGGRRPAMASKLEYYSIANRLIRV
jgi:hypothetical protein